MHLMSKQMAPKPAFKPPPWLGRVSEVTIMPTMMLVFIVVGYLLGDWIGRTWFPDSLRGWQLGGFLYGLAGAIYTMIKTMRQAYPKDKDGDGKLDPPNYP